MANKSKKASLKKLKALESVPNYMKNVSKSLLYSGKGVVKDIMPTVSEFISSNAEVTNDVIKGVRDSKAIMSRYSKQIKESPTMKAAESYKKNLLEDLKTGKFSNQDRIQNDAANMGEHDEELDFLDNIDNLDFGFDDNDEDLGFDDSSDSKPTKKNISINNITVKSGSNNNTLDSMMAISNISATASVKSAELITANATNLYAMESITASRINSEISSRMQEMSGYLKGLFDYTANITTHFEKVGEYQSKSIEVLGELSKNTELIKEINKIYTTTEQTKEITNPMGDTFGAEGSFNIKGYMEYVTKNVKNEMSSSLIGSNIQQAKMMAGDNWLEQFASSPLEFIPKMMVSKFLGTDVKQSMAKLDKTVSNFFKTGALKLTNIIDKKGEENGIFSKISDIFGLKFHSKSIDTSSYLKQAIPFDGITKKAITEVIPTYLRQIVSILSGKEESIYSYEDGKFYSKDKLTEKRNELLDSGYNSIMSYRDTLMETAKGLNLDETSLESVKSQVTDFLKEITDKGKFFNPTKYNNTDELNEDGIYSIIDDSNLNLIKGLMQSAGLDKAIENGSQIIDSRERLASINKDIGENLAVNGFSTFYNGSVNYKENSLMEYMKNKQDSSKAEEYLSDIRDILFNGVMVVDITKRRRGMNIYRRTMQDIRRNTTSPNMSDLLVGESNSDNKTEESPSSDDEGESQRKKRTVSIDDLAKDSAQSIINRIDGFKFINTEREENSSAKQVKSFFTNVQNIFKTPQKFINGLIDNADQRLYDIIYGNHGADKRKSFINELLGNINGIKDGIIDHLAKLIKPINEIIFGANGITGKIHDILSKTKNKAANLLLGEADETGSRKNGLLSGLMNEFKDVQNKAMYKMFGKGYVSAKDGTSISDSDTSLYSTMKESLVTNFNKFKDYSVSKFFGDVKYDSKGEPLNEGKRTGGIFSELFNSAKNQFTKFKNKFFGESFDGKESDIKSTLTKAIPKMGLGAVGGLGLSAFSSLMPIGIGAFPAMLLGMGSSLALSSDKVKSWLFGDVDNNKEGVIPKKYIDAFNKYGKSMGVSGVAGTLLGKMIGLPPILGMFLGSGIGFVSKSEKAKEFLFGKDGDDSNALIKKKYIDATKKILPKSMLGFLGFSLIGKMGALGSMLVPGGPIGAAILGLTASIVSESDRAKDFLFGKKNAEDNREGGLFDQARNYLIFEIMEPLKFKMFEGFNYIKLKTRERVLNPLLTATKPFIEEFKLIGKKVKNKSIDILKFFKNKIDEQFDRAFGTPLTKLLKEKLFDPLGKMFSKLGKGFFNLITMPFVMIGKKGEKLANKHARMGMDYVDDWRDKKNKRNAKLNKDKAEFDFMKADRESKLDSLRERMRAAKYKSTDENGRTALEDYNYFYKKGAWKDSKRSSYSGLKIMVDQNEKAQKTRDKINENLNAFKDTVSGKYKDFKDYSKGIWGSMKDDLSNIASKFKTKDPKTKNPTVGENKHSKVFTVDPSGNVFTNYKDPKKSKMKYNYATNDNTNYESPMDNENDSKTYNYKQDKSKSTSIRQPKRVDGRDVKSISDKVNDIRNEVVGELSGVGYNMQIISSILCKRYGTPSNMNMQDHKNNKRKGAMGRFFNGLKSYAQNKTESIRKGVGGFFSGAGKAVKDLLSLPKIILTGMTNTFSEILRLSVNMLTKATEVFGNLLNSTISVIGNTLNTSIKVIGSAVNNILQTIPDLIKSTVKAGALVVEGLGQVAKGVLATIGNGLNALSSLTKNLLKVGGQLFESISSLVIKTIPKFIDNLLEGGVQIFTSLVTRPINAVKNKMTGKKGMSVFIEGGHLDYIGKAENITPVKMDSDDSKPTIDTKGNVENPLYVVVKDSLLNNPNNRNIKSDGITPIPMNTNIEDKKEDAGTKILSLIEEKRKKEDGKGDGLNIMQYNAKEKAEAEEASNLGYRNKMNSLADGVLGFLDVNKKKKGFDWGTLLTFAVPVFKKIWDFFKNKKWKIIIDKVKKFFLEQIPKLLKLFNKTPSVNVNSPVLPPGTGFIPQTQPMILPQPTAPLLANTVGTAGQFLPVPNVPKKGGMTPLLPNSPNVPLLTAGTGNVIEGVGYTVKDAPDKVSFLSKMKSKIPFIGGMGSAGASAGTAAMSGAATTTGASGMMGTITSLATNPVTIAVAGAIGLSLLPKILPKMTEGFENAVPKFGEMLTNTLPNLIDKGITKFSTFIGNLGDNIVKGVELLGEAIPKLLGTLITNLPKIVWGLAKSIGKITLGLGKVVAKLGWTIVKTVFKSAISLGKTIITLPFKIGKSVGESVWNFFHGKGFKTNDKLKEEEDAKSNKNILSEASIKDSELEKLIMPQGEGLDINGTGQPVIGGDSTSMYTATSVDNMGIMYDENNKPVNYVDNTNKSMSYTYNNDTSNNSVSPQFIQNPITYSGMNNNTNSAINVSMGSISPENQQQDPSIKNLLSGFMLSEPVQGVLGKKYSLHTTHITNALMLEINKLNSGNTKLVKERLIKKVKTLEKSRSTAILQYEGIASEAETVMILGLSSDVPPSADMRFACGFAKMVDTNVTLGSIDITTLASAIYGAIEKVKNSSTQAIKEFEYESKQVHEEEKQAVKMKTAENVEQSKAEQSILYSEDNKTSSSSSSNSSASAMNEVQKHSVINNYGIKGFDDISKNTTKSTKKKKESWWTRTKNNVSKQVKKDFGKVKKFFSFGNGSEEMSSSGSGTNKSRNGMAYFSQGDPRWSGVDYTAPGESPQTIQSAGCGPTSMAMVLSSYLGKTITPQETAAYSLANGLKAPDAGTYWSFFSHIGQKYGVDVSQFVPGSSEGFTMLRESLKARKPVILSGTGSNHPFTTGGHFVVATGINSDGTKISVNDPINEQRSIEYPAQQLAQDAAMAWATSKDGKGLTGEYSPSDDGSSSSGKAKDNKPEGVFGVLGRMGELFGGYVESTVLGEKFDPNKNQSEESNDTVTSGDSTISLNGFKSNLDLDPKTLKPIGKSSQGNDVYGNDAIRDIKQSPDNFIKLIKPMAFQNQKDFGIPASTTIAQAACESGWLGSVIGNNIFGIKEGSYKGPVVSAHTREVGAGGDYYINDNFRFHEGILASVRDHGANVINGNPQYYSGVKTMNWEQSIDGLGPYATDPNYKVILKDIVRANGLDKLNNEAKSWKGPAVGKGEDDGKGKEPSNNGIVPKDINNKRFSLPSKILKNIPAIGKGSPNYSNIDKSSIKGKKIKGLDCVGTNCPAIGKGPDKPTIIRDNRQTKNDIKVNTVDSNKLSEIVKSMYSRVTDKLNGLNISEEIEKQSSTLSKDDINKIIQYLDSITNNTAGIKSDTEKLVEKEQEIKVYQNDKDSNVPKSNPKTPIVNNVNPMVSVETNSKNSKTIKDSYTNARNIAKGILD